MSIFLDENSKIIVQGITGSEGSKHATRMLEAGSNIVGGTNPRKAGQTLELAGKELPIFGTVKEAIEATGANVFFVQNGVLHTPRVDHILDGITRQTIIQMLKDNGTTVHERRIKPEELSGFQECFLTGTAAEVTPVGQIGDWNFQVGPTTRKISDDYEKLVRA